MHDVAPITTAGNDELELPRQDKSAKPSLESTQDNQERVTMKWASMWRSIMLSGLDKTLFPYSHFIRALRLGDLLELLMDDKFRVQRVANSLFAGDMAKYRVDKTLQATRKKNKYILIDAEATVNNFAEVITQHAPMLEEFWGNQQLDPGIVARSIPRLPNLQTLSVTQGEVLEGLGPLLRSHCPLFNSLSIYGWQHPNADEHLAALLNEIRPNSIRSFNVHSRTNIGAETFVALNRHQGSLRELKLSDLKPEAVPCLPLLRECTNVETLLLAERLPPTQDLEQYYKESFSNMVAWLRNCTTLRTLTIRNFISGPALLREMFLESNIKLSRLELESYSMAESKGFHQALAHHPSLQHLSLRGESSEVTYDSDVLVESLSTLQNLTELRLREISESFVNKHIKRLASSLPKLEVLWTSGTGLTDDVWEAVASLRNLRTLEFTALTCFTANGIIDFITSLDREGNRGLLLNVAMQENDCDIPEQEQALIKQTIEEHLDGEFKFMLWKGRRFQYYCLPYKFSRSIQIASPLSLHT